MLHPIGIYVDPATYYEAAAEHCAIQGYDNPQLAIALLDLPQSTIDDILANPHAWTQRVNDYAYSIAMRGQDD